MASASLYTAYVDIEARGASQTAASLKAVDAAAGSAEGKVQSLGSSLKSVGSSMTAAGKSMTMFVSAPIAAVGVGMVKLASDAEETASKFRTVFGKDAAGINRWATDLMKVMPSTRQEIQAMAAELQDFLVPMGVAPGKAKEMTKTLVPLIGDLASFNNLPIADVQRDVMSALSGQTEAMRKYGVDTSAATLEAIAYKEGIAAQGAELTQQQKIQAIYAQLLNDTTKAQGDMARTADSTANSFKFLWREIKEAATAFGRDLLPVITPVVQRLTGLAGVFGNLSPTVRAVIIGVAAFAAALGPLLIVVGMVVSALGSLVLATGAATLGAAFVIAATAVGAFLVALLPVIAAVGALAAVGILLYKSWSRITPLLQPLIGVVKNLGAMIRAIFVKDAVAWAQAWNKLPPSIQPVARVLTHIIAVARNFIQVVIRQMVRWFNQNLPLMQRTADVVFKRITQLIRFGAKTWFAVIKAFLGPLVTFWRNNWNQIRTILVAVWNIIRRTISTAVRIIGNIIKLGLQVITGDWKGAWNTIQRIGQLIWNNIKGNLRDLWRIITSLFKIAGRTLLNIWKNQIWQPILKFVQTKKREIENTIENLKKRALEIFRSLPAPVKDAFIAVGKAMTGPIESARDTLQGVWNSIIDGIAKVLSAVGLGELANKVKSAKWGSGGSTDRVPNQGATPTSGEAFAKGGVGTKTRKPKLHVWNEQYGNEAYIVENRPTREQLPYLRTAARWHGMDLVPRHRSGRRGYGEGLGATLPVSHLASSVEPIARAVEQRFPQTTQNTYVGHPGGSQHSFDTWGGGGRGSPIGSSTGEAVKNFLFRNYPAFRWLIWAGRIFSSPGQSRPYTDASDMHYDHVHYTGGGGGVMQSLWDTVGAALWNRLVQNPYDRATADFVNGFVLRAGAKRGGQNVLDGIKAMIMERAGVSGTGLPQGKSPGGLTLGEVVGQTWPSNERRTAIGVAWEESGARADAQNPSGARGLFQIMPGTASAVGADYGKLYDPLYNSGAGSKVQNLQGWGAWVVYPPSSSSMAKGSQRVTGYARGGITGGAPTLGWNLVGRDGYLGFHGPAARAALNAAGMWRASGVRFGRGRDVFASFKPGRGGGRTGRRGNMSLDPRFAGTRVGPFLWAHEIGHALGLGHSASGIMTPRTHAGQRPSQREIDTVRRLHGGPVEVEEPGGGGSSARGGGGGNRSYARVSITRSQNVSGRSSAISGAGTARAALGATPRRFATDLRAEILADVREQLQVLTDDVNRIGDEQAAILKDQPEAAKKLVDRTLRTNRFSERVEKVLEGMLD